MSYFVDVIVPLPLEKYFTYSITETEFEILEIGMRIAVPFGKIDWVFSDSLSRDLSRNLSLIFTIT